jgi:hypothetical protein
MRAAEAPTSNGCWEESVKYWKGNQLPNCKSQCTYLKWRPGARHGGTMHACNLSYLGSRDKRITLEASLGQEIKIYGDPIQTNWAGLCVYNAIYLEVGGRRIVVQGQTRQKHKSLPKYKLRQKDK